MTTQPTPRPEFLDSALACGAVLTGKPNGTEPVTVVFSPEAWRKFDSAQQADEQSIAVLKAEVRFYKRLWEQDRARQAAAKAPAAQAETRKPLAVHAHLSQRVDTQIADALAEARAASPASPAPAAQADTESLYVAYGDDAAVDLFAAAMKAKMAASRAKGRSGWHDPAECSAERLQIMLIEHLSKGDPVDIGNFAMMLWNRGDPVAAPTTVFPNDGQEPDWGAYASAEAATPASTPEASQQAAAVAVPSEPEGWQEWAREAIRLFGSAMKEMHWQGLEDHLKEMQRKGEVLLRAAPTAGAATTSEDARDARIAVLEQALTYYAEGNHLMLADADAWDTVSGEPMNFMCDEAGTATVEDGTVAKCALAGDPLSDDEERLVRATQQEPKK